MQAAKLLPPTPGDRQFGWDVDVRGDVVVVGAPGDDANGPDAGAVYVFEPAGPFEPWQQTSVVYQCDPSVVSPCGDTAAGTGFDGAGFGFSVDLTDQFLLVGAPGFQSSAGGAWVYQRSGNDWQTSTAGVIGRTGTRNGGPRRPVTSSGMPSPQRMPARTSSWALPVRHHFVGIDAGQDLLPAVGRLGSVCSGRVDELATNPTAIPGPQSKWRLDAQGDVWMFSGQPVNTRFEDGTQPGELVSRGGTCSLPGPP